MSLRVGAADYIRVGAAVWVWLTSVENLKLFFVYVLLVLVLKKFEFCEYFATVLKIQFVENDRKMTPSKPDFLVR
jgi:hypothetical protein